MFLPKKQRVAKYKEDSIFDLELYLADVANDQKVLDGNIVKLEDLLYLFTGMDRLLSFGMPQKMG